MLTSRRRKDGKEIRHDKFICSKCLGTIGFTYDWNFCPFCGEVLFPAGLNRSQRIEIVNKLYREGQP